MQCVCVCKAIGVKRIAALGAVLKPKLLPTPWKSALTGAAMSLAAREFSEEPCASQVRSSMVRAARGLLSAVTRLLILADMVDVHLLLNKLNTVSILRTLEWVLKRYPPALESHQQCDSDNLSPKLRWISSQQDSNQLFFSLFQGFYSYNANKDIFLLSFLSIQTRWSDS